MLIKENNVSYCINNSNFTWWKLRPLWLNNDFGPSPKNSSPHAVVERMCCQAEEFIAAVCAQTMNEQREINSHDSFAQKHAEPRLVLLSGRSQQRDQR